MKCREWNIVWCAPGLCHSGVATDLRADNEQRKKSYKRQSHTSFPSFPSYANDSNWPDSWKTYFVKRVLSEKEDSRSGLAVVLAEKKSVNTYRIRSIS